MLSQLYGYLSEYQKGLLLIMAGTILLLYAAGLAEYILGIMVTVSALALIAEGLNKTNYHTKLLALLKFNKNKP